MVIEREIRIHSLQSGKKNSQLREPGPQAHGPKPMATKHGLASSPRASTSLLSRTHTSQRNVARHSRIPRESPPVPKRSPPTSYLTSFLIPQRRQRKRKPEETRRDNMIRSSRFRKDFKLKTEHRSGGVGGRQRHKRESDKSERAVGSRRLSRPPPPRSGAQPPGRPQIRTTWGPRHQIGRKIEVIFVAAAG